MIEVLLASVLFLFFTQTMFRTQGEMTEKLATRYALEQRDLLEKASERILKRTEKTRLRS